MTEEIYKQLPERLIPWYKENARDLPWRKDKEPYHIWISEIMLQQTRVEAVKNYYRRFLKAFPDIASLARAKEDRLMKMWEGLGYYNRARNLQKSAVILMEEYNGIFPSEYSEIRKLPGIGEYTAGAIASNCFDEPVAAVDGNVLRVISRLTESYDDILRASVKRKVKEELEKIYPKTGCGDFTQSLMELGATVCMPAGKPECSICPVGDLCIAHKKGTEMELPVKKKKKERKVEERTVFILRCRDRVALTRRQNSGLLAGMWEFPNVLGKQTAEEAVAVAEAWGCRPQGLEREIERSHIFSHIQWEMTGYYITCQREAQEFVWVSEKELYGEKALPTAFRKFCIKDSRKMIRNTI